MKLPLACLALVLTAGSAAAQPPPSETVATSQALSNAAHNATNNQQQSYVTMQASTTQGVATLLSPEPERAAQAPACEAAECPKPPPPGRAGLANDETPDKQPDVPPKP
ncbi:RebB family R body protein [Phenylobacterium sp.]|uniref:RebB family R body protein n=1 Tax=Phenylobacterium sp. TaxID=1871053 RepID=UPI002BC0F29F|nr:RebB family R body protein [Phenylobacterium sp.]HVI30786.1 RebB family R body protein [Phenylobacterium sp.]